jgi:ATP-dependent DNA helicase RecQ
MNFALNASADFTTTQVISACSLTRPRADLLLKILAVEGAIERNEEGWNLANSSWQFDSQKYEVLVQARRADSQKMAQYAAGQTCLETQLRIALDDDVDDGAVCGRCSVCVGHLPDGLPGAPSEASIFAAQKFLRGQDNVIEHRKQWPAGLVVEGLPIKNLKMANELRLEDGRALAFADDAIWDSFIPDQNSDGPLTEELKIGLNEMLARWKPSVDIITPIPSSRHPQLVSSLANHIAVQLGLPVEDVLGVEAPESNASRTDAVQRPREIARRVSVSNNPAVIGKRLLLVDDTCASRWTITIAGAHLRNRGAISVTPFVLHQKAAADA